MTLESPAVLVKKGQSYEAAKSWKNSEVVHLVSLVVARHCDAGRRDGGQVGADLVQTQGVLHPLLGTMHQHLLELHWNGGNWGDANVCTG